MFLSYLVSALSFLPRSLQKQIYEYSGIGDRYMAFEVVPGAVWVGYDIIDDSVIKTRIPSGLELAPVRVFSSEGERFTRRIHPTHREPPPGERPASPATKGKRRDHPTETDQCRIRTEDPQENRWVCRSSTRRISSAFRLGNEWIEKRLAMILRFSRFCFWRCSSVKDGLLS